MRCLKDLTTIISIIECRTKNKNITMTNEKKGMNTLRNRWELKLKPGKLELLGIKEQIFWGQRVIKGAERLSQPFSERNRIRLRLFGANSDKIIIK